MAHVSKTTSRPPSDGPHRTGFKPWLKLGWELKFQKDWVLSFVNLRSPEANVLMN